MQIEHIQNKHTALWFKPINSVLWKVFNLVILLNFCKFLLQIPLPVLPMFALNSKGFGTYLCAHELHHLLVTARRSPGCLFVHVTLSLIPFFLPSFLPAEHREPDQQQFKLESDIQIFQSVFNVYTRFLERGKFDNCPFIIAIETENETDRIAPEKKPGCPTVYLSQRNSPISV